MKTVLTSEIKDYIKQNYNKELGSDIARKLSISQSVVNCYKRKHNLQMPKEVYFKLKGSKLKGRTTFTKSEDQFIRVNYLTKPIKTIASELNRSGCGVIGRLKVLGLSIPEEIIRKRKEDSYYKKGRIPENKGKKQTEYMSEESIEKTKETRFKKGRKSHNQKPEGYISIRKDKNGNHYKWLKHKGEMQPMHHVVFLQKHKEIPKKKIIIFKDGNTLNPELSNLECISKAENMQRNTIHRYPKDLKKAIRKISRIKKQLNEQ